MNLFTRGFTLEKKYFLAIDCGTSALKAVVYDKKFKPVAKASSEIVTVYPKPNWAEQDPNAWWKTTVQCIRQDLKKIDPEEVMGVGFTSQCHGLVLVDEGCNPIMNCLIWPDLRAIAQAEELNISGVVAEGNWKPGPEGISAHYTAAKLLWVKQNLPNAFDKTYKFLIPKDFLRTKLTMDFVTDVIGAGYTQLFDMSTGQWDWKLVDYIDFPREKMPKIHPTEEVVGYITKSASTETGLVEGTPVIAGQCNGPITPILMSLANKGKIKPNEDYIILYTGTAPAIYHFSSRAGFQLEFEEMTTPSPFFVGSLSASGGGLIKWYKEQFGSMEEQAGLKMNLSPYQILDEGASKIEPGAEGLIFLPHMMGERGPYNDFARGVLYGLSLGHRREHFYRAILEGITFQLKLLYDIGQGIKDIKIDKMIMFGGGSKSEIWKQITADIFGYPLYTVTEEEAATLNIACMISVGLKVYPDFKEAAKYVDVDFKDITYPGPDSKKYEKPYALFKKVSEAMQPVFTKKWNTY